MRRLPVFIIIGLIVISSVAYAGSPKADSSKSSKDKTVELTYWVPLNPNVSAVVQEMGQTQYAIELQKRTNVKIKYQHPAGGDDNQINAAFNILNASGSYPDIIEYKWIDYPGGPNAAIDNKVILQLNDVFKKYCPNITKFLKDNPDIAKMIATDDGKYYVFPFLRGTSAEDNPMLVSEGFVIRKDLLNKLKMDVPQTPDEWYAMLNGFKSLGIKTPLTLRKDHVSRAISPGFDSWDTFYVDNGKVKNGLIEPNRLAYLTAVHKWYAEGLLDNDYFAVDKKTQATKILNSVSAATYAPGGSGIGTWLPALKKTDPSIELTSAPPMTPVRGRNAKFSYMGNIYGNNGYSAAISTQCKNVAVAAKLLDYNYGDEGHMLANFGIEGVSYTMKNGYPTYTDLVMKNPEGLSMVQVMSKYIRGHIHGPFVQDKRELEQYYEMPELKQALVYWTKSDMGKHLMPPVSPTVDESTELASIVNNINTYKEEMEAKFIIGAEPLSKFPEYQAQLKAFGIERAIAIEQKCYDRYRAR